MAETVLVIGGTGQLGAPVARQLRSDGYRVRLLARKPPAARHRDPGLEYVPGNLDDTDSLRGALAGCAGACERARRALRRPVRPRRAPRTSSGR